MTAAERLFARQTAGALLGLTAVLVPIFVLFNGVEAISGGWAPLSQALWRVPAQLYALGPILAALAGGVVALRWRSTGEVWAVSLTGRSPAYLARSAGLSGVLASVVLAVAFEASRPSWPTVDGWSSSESHGQTWWIDGDRDGASVVVLRSGQPVALGTVTRGHAQARGWRANRSLMTRAIGDFSGLDDPTRLAFELAESQEWWALCGRLLWPLWGGLWALTVVAMTLRMGSRGAVFGVLLSAALHLGDIQLSLAMRSGQSSWIPLVVTWSLALAAPIIAAWALHRRGVSPRE